uniref:FAD-binding PCMH-type domain-containing protein n=1 Tax=Penicillium paxilli TaxID=70109 RepID=E3UBL7_PENPX|nr:hypothetical protein PP121 [Penicillium paxilli]
MTSSELPIIWRDDGPRSEYEAWRTRTFNAKRPDNLPLAIIKPTTVEHIVAATKLVNQHDVRLAIRSGGHSLQSWSLRNDSILVDLENFNLKEFDEATGVVSVSPTVTSSELLLFLEDKKRFFPVGHSGEVGLGGFVLQGGIGLNCRTYGYACEYLTAVDVVTVSGEIKHCSPDENEDLYWAARGSGPDNYETVFRWVLDILPKLSDDIEPTIFGFTLPNTPIPVIAFHAHVHAVSDEVISELLQPIHDSRPPSAIVEQPSVTTTVQQEFNAGHAMMPPGSRYFTESVFLTDETDLVEACRTLFTILPAQSPGSLAYWEPMKHRNDLPDMAMSIHGDHYVSLMAIYADPKQDEAKQSWVLNCFREMDAKGWLVGTYVGDAHPIEWPHRYWKESAQARIQEIGAKWDPHSRITGTIFGNS